jgi:hypothetical protein
VNSLSNIHDGAFSMQTGCDANATARRFNHRARRAMLGLSFWIRECRMNVWLHALLSSAAVGLIVAFLRAATLGDIVQRYSARAKTSDGKSGVSDVVDAMAANHGPTLNRFTQNLSDPAFWRIVFGLWFSITALGFATCAVMIWTS